MPRLLCYFALQAINIDYRTRLRERRFIYTNVYTHVYISKHVTCVSLFKRISKHSRMKTFIKNK